MPRNDIHGSRNHGEITVAAVNFKYDAGSQSITICGFRGKASKRTDYGEEVRHSWGFKIREDKEWHHSGGELRLASIGRVSVSNEDGLATVAVMGRDLLDTLNMSPLSFHQALRLVSTALKDGESTIYESYVGSGDVPTVWPGFDTCRQRLESWPGCQRLCPITM